jgi:hypothetical protein
MRTKLPSIARSRDTISLRFEDGLMSQLRAQSEEGSDSINSTVNKILRLYYSWYLPAQKVGLRYVHKDVLNGIVEYLTEDQITKLAKGPGVNAFRSIIEMSGKEYSLECVLDFMKTWLQVTALPYWHEENSTKITYVIEHRMGKKWALFLEKVLVNIIEQISPNSYELKSNESTIRIVIYLDEKDKAQKRTRRAK